MQQEIEFFWPLTEQIPLDLDYSQCSPHQYWLRAKGIAGLHGPYPVGMTYVTNNPGTVSLSTRIGDWEVQKQDTKPNKIHQWMMNKIFGMKWMGR